MFRGHQSFFSTTASVLRCGVVGKDFLVVVDDAAHVRHAAVADFYVVVVVFSTTASVLRCGVVGKDFLVVVDDAAHVRHAAVADFYVVVVKDGVQIVV